MSRIRTHKPRGLWSIVFVASLAVAGLYACGGSNSSVPPGGGNGGNNGGGTPPPPPPLAPAGTPIAITAISNPGGGNTTLTASNTFAVGDVVILAGTGSATLTGQAVVVAATSTTVTVAIPFDPAATTTSATVAPTGGAVTGCSTTGATSAITLSGVPSRISGVAPLAVFFDATTTTATATSQPFHDLEYQWDFGDAAGGATWGTGSRAGASSKNAARGPMAAHVFETPGNYIVTLTVTDGPNSVTNNCVQIGVGDPNAIYAGTKTTCVSAAGSFAGCPAGAATVTNANFDTALAAALGAGKRALFNGGDTFTSTTTTTFTATGPAEIGAYGAGKPIVHWSGAPSASGVIRVGGTASDLRITGLEFDGQNLSTAQFFMSFQNTAWTNLLVLNNYVHGWGGYMQPDWGGSGGFGFFVFGNQFDTPAPGSTTDMNLVSGGSKAAMIGNIYAMGAQGQQVVRLNMMQRFIVSDNSVSGAFGTSGNQKETIAVRSSPTSAAGPGVISGNSVSVGPGYVGIFPSSATGDLGVSNILIEGNYIFGANSGLATNGIQTNATRVTVRNNIIDASDANMNFGITLRGTNGGFSIPSKEVHVYNNSVYSSKVSGALTGISVDTDVDSGNEIKNNLVYTSGITGIAVSDPGSKAAKLNNTGDPAVAPGVVTLNPNWTITAPMTPLTNFQPGAGSYAIDLGVPVSVFSDFFGAARVGTYDLGAVNP